MRFDSRDGREGSSELDERGTFLSLEMNGGPEVDPGNKEGSWKQGAVS